MWGWGFRALKFLDFFKFLQKMNQSHRSRLTTLFKSVATKDGTLIEVNSDRIADDFREYLQIMDEKEKKGTVDLEQFLCYIDESLKHAALAFMHSYDPPILHRDLKSLNLLLDTHLTLKVCDFGLCRKMARKGENMTRAVGTLQWMVRLSLRFFTTSKPPPLKKCNTQSGTRNVYQ